MNDKIMKAYNEEKEKFRKFETKGPGYNSTFVHRLIGMIELIFMAGIQDHDWWMNEYMEIHEINKLKDDEWDEIEERREQNERF